MPLTETKEIKTWQWIAVGLIIMAALGYKAYTVFYWPRAEIKIAGQEFRVIVADTDKHRFKGLSDKNSLGKYGGMLFVFRETSQHTMVMRDMRFPLDIIWIEKGRVVDIAPNLKPEYGLEEDELTPYFARASSDMVLELPAGFAEKYGLKIGDRVEIGE